MIPLAPIIAKVFWGALIGIIGSIVFRILVALGVGVVTFYGIDLVQNQIRDALFSNLMDVPSEVLSLVALMKIGQCINIILSAVAIRFSFKAGGKASGAITTWFIMRRI